MGFVSALLHQFTGYVPASASGPRVVGPPTSTLSPEQLEASRTDPLSFRHAAGRGAAASNAEALDWLEQCQTRGILVPAGPTVFVYRQSADNTSVTGVIADVSLDAYNSGLVKRHETTIAKTQQRMVDYMRSTRVYGNPVALTHRPHAGMSEAIAAHTQRAPDTSFTSADGLSHQLWALTSAAAEEVCQGFSEPLYVTDGHHRLAGASALAAEEQRPATFFPAGLFCSDELTLRAFARCVVDTEIDADAAVDRLRAKHQLEEVDQTEARPRRRTEFGVKIRDRYFRMRIEATSTDPYASLDVNILQDLVLDHVFGIAEPRKDKRLRFVADLSDSGHPDSDADVSFLPFPVPIEDVMAIADSGRVMPPKSTWFAPKLPSGLVIRTLDRP